MYFAYELENRKSLTWTLWEQGYFHSFDEGAETIQEWYSALDQASPALFGLLHESHAQGGEPPKTLDRFDPRIVLVTHYDRA